MLVAGMTQVGYYSRPFFPVYHPRTYLTSSYFGNLGYAYPTALGAKVACPEKAVVAVSGDGGFLFNSQEIATAVLHDIGAIAVVFKDDAYGNVLRDQENRFDGRVYGAQASQPRLREAGAGLRRRRVPRTRRPGAAEGAGGGHRAGPSLHSSRSPWGPCPQGRSAARREGRRTVNVGIVGMGTIGRTVARELDRERVPGIRLAALSSRDLPKAKAFATTLANAPRSVPLAEMPPLCDLVIEAAGAEAVGPVAETALAAGVSDHGAELRRPPGATGPRGPGATRRAR